MKITLNFEQLQQADNGDTTYYGGVVLVNGEEVRAHGTDRDWDMQIDIQEKIEALIGRELTDSETEAFEDQYVDSNQIDSFDIEFS